MTKELETRIRAIYNMKGGQLDPKFFNEFIELCKRTLIIDQTQAVVSAFINTFLSCMMNF